MCNTRRMHLRGGEEGEGGGLEPTAEKERDREEGASVKVHVSVAAAVGQRSMMLATVTVMELGVVVWLTVTLLHEDVPAELHTTPSGPGVRGHAHSRAYFTREIRFRYHVFTRLPSQASSRRQQVHCGPRGQSLWQGCM